MSCCPIINKKKVKWNYWNNDKYSVNKTRDLINEAGYETFYPTCINPLPGTINHLTEIAEHLFTNSKKTKDLIKVKELQYDKSQWYWPSVPQKKGNFITSDVDRNWILDWGFYSNNKYRAPDGKPIDITDRDDMHQWYCQNYDEQGNYKPGSNYGHYSKGVSAWQDVYWPGSTFGQCFKNDICFIQNDKKGGSTMSTYGSCRNTDAECYKVSNKSIFSDRHDSCYEQTCLIEHNGFWDEWNSKSCPLMDNARKGNCVCAPHKFTYPLARNLYDCVERYSNIVTPATKLILLYSADDFLSQLIGLYRVVQGWETDWRRENAARLMYYNMVSSLFCDEGPEILKKNGLVGYSVAALWILTNAGLCYLGINKIDTNIYHHVLHKVHNNEKKHAPTGLPFLRSN